MPAPKQQAGRSWLRARAQEPVQRPLWLPLALGWLRPL
jgi:hypothetical protein